MSETFYRKTTDRDDFLAYSKWHEPVGEFRKVAWCQTHDHTNPWAMGDQCDWVEIWVEVWQEQPKETE